jgi:hypothetical protein
VVLQGKKMTMNIVIVAWFWKAKKWWQITTLFIVTIMWFYKCEKSTMNNYIVQHCCDIVLQAQGGWWTMNLVVGVVLVLAFYLLQIF